MDEFDLNIAIFDGGSDDLLSLDLSFVNLQFHKIESKEFATLLATFSGTYHQRDSGIVIASQSFEDSFYHRQVFDHRGGYRPYLYALVPIDLTKKVGKDEFGRLEEVLLIMFPSGLQLTDLAQYQRENTWYIESMFDHWDYVTHWHLKEDRTSQSHLFRLDHERIDEINEFLPRCYNWLAENKGFGLAINSYIDGFTQKNIRMAFVLFCICLESITKAQSEIVHQISRTCAVVNADSKEDGRIIYKNSKLLYELRSKIVHGDIAKNISKYLFNLVALTSRTIIELVSLEIHDREQLSKLVIENGYGDKVNIASKYKKYLLNKEAIDLMLQKLDKLK